MVTKEDLNKKSLNPTIVYRQVVDNLDDYEFIRLLRTNPETVSSFVYQGEITKEQQIEYMKTNASSYWIAEYYGDKTRLGFFGIIDNDIRYCVVPEYQNMGVGTGMLGLIRLLFPNATGKIKRENTASIKAFDKAGIPYTLI